MAYSSQILTEINKIFTERRKKSLARSNYCEEVLLNDENYVKALNAYNSTRFEISKARFKGETKKVLELEKTAKTQLDEIEKIKNQRGFKTEDFLPVYECKDCSDTGTLKNGKRCKCFKKEVSRLTFETLGITNKKFPSFKTAKYMDVNNLEKIYGKIKKFCEVFPDTTKNIIISGTVGTGKSYLAGCVANDLLKKGYNVVFITAIELNAILLKYHTAPIDEKSLYLEVLTDCDLLIIDDLGTEPIYQNVTSEYLLTILSERTLKQKPFIITTNLDQEHLLMRYQERTLSRINDKRNGVFIQITGEDLRIKRD